MLNNIPLRSLSFMKKQIIVRKILKRPESTLAQKFSTGKALPSKFDVVIVGGGCIGSSIALWLKKMAGQTLNILIIDQDLTYKTASTVLSVGGVRQQFTIKESVQLSCFGAHFLNNISSFVGKSVDVQFRRNGYLSLTSKKGAAKLEENHKKQLCWGAVNKLLNTSDLGQKFPWLNTDDIKLACLGQKNEGWFDPWMFLIALRDSAKELGVQYIQGVPEEFNMSKVKNNIENRTTVGIAQDHQHVLNSVVVKTPNGKIEKIEFKTCIVATGSETGKFTKEFLNLDRRNPGALQYEVPIERRKRYVYVLECPTEEISPDDPMIIDISGLYIRKEGANKSYICGFSPSEHEEPSTDDLNVDYEFFDQVLWPILAHRIPCFEATRVRSGWAGFYDYNVFDQNGIIDFHPAYKNMIIAAGFSGHGIQHSPGVGRAVSELLLCGRFETIDLSCFGFDRIIKNEPLIEDKII